MDYATVIDVFKDLLQNLMPVIVVTTLVGVIIRMVVRALKGKL